MVLRFLSVAALAGATLFSQGCGSGDRPAAPKTAAKIPEMNINLYDGTGRGVQVAANDARNDCENRSPFLGVENGNPNEDQICTLPPRPISDAVDPNCPCGATCLRPYFDHNQTRNPEGSIQMYTPPNSRRYYPGVPSAKHWENGVTQNIFTFDVELTNFYDTDLDNVFIVLVDIDDGEGNDDGREGFEDARPHTCLNNEYAVWSFGDIAAGETKKRTVKLYLPNDEGFTITGFVVSLSGEECDTLLQDADGDNISDGNEDVNGNNIVDPGETDPNDPDTDGDGLFDSAEDNSGVYVSWWETGTDPVERDTDGDCFGDGTEIVEGYDPLDDNDHPDRKCSKADLSNPNP